MGGRQPARLLLMVGCFAPPQAELMPRDRHQEWALVGAASRSVCSRLHQDRPDAPDECGIRAVDQHDLVPKQQLVFSCTSWGGSGGCPCVVLRCALPWGVHISVRISGRVARRVPSSRDDCDSSPVSVGARACSCRVGLEGSTTLFDNSTLCGGGSKSVPLSRSLATHTCA